MAKLECKHGGLNRPCLNKEVLADLFKTFDGIEISQQSLDLAAHYASIGMHIRLGKNPVNVGETEAFCTGEAGCIGRNDRFFT